MTTPPALRQTHKLQAEPKRSRTNWHVRRPTYGPRRLAIKNHIVAVVGEFVGVLLYIAFSFGFSLVVCAWVFFRVSGGLFNPAITLGMLLVGALSPIRAAIVVVAQIVGGIAGSAIIYGLLPGTLNVRTTLAEGVSPGRGLCIEMFMTALLMLTILLLAAEKHKGTFLAPLPIGLSLFLAELVSPARSFGPSVVLGEFAGSHWIYWVGPALGAVIAAGVYRFIKFLEYETVLGPEPNEHCHHPVLQIMTTNTGSVDNLPATSGETVEPKQAYAIEGTGFGESLGPAVSVNVGHTGHAAPHGGSTGGPTAQFGPHGGHLSIAGYDARFDQLEAMMRELMSAQQLARVESAGSSHFGGGAGGHGWRERERKGSVATTLVEQPEGKEKL
ncbi:hypothetical protein Rhopal_000388-T1 [Rhodotorula paludigena]|uniref:Aquaporin-like protein n=1 Tax=Rhodotorula paludigena TaxID=86838 RepID=A0AAV5GDJ9_9BASI|nr:hypothetical protein Rhopal_000388-T1 [Rhodotorula paludigena]